MARGVSGCRSTLVVLTIGLGVLIAGGAVWALTTDMTLISTLHEPKAEHTDQQELLTHVKNQEYSEAFEKAFEHGDEFFETEFDALDGVGANVGDGTRFTRVPRADLTGPGQWATHYPKRATGPNALSCNACHIQLFDDGAGSAVGNVHRDPQHSGNLKQFIQRNTPHVFALGAVQRLAEEMTVQLHKDRDLVASQACTSLTGTASGPLAAKGVRFGSIRATRVGPYGCNVSYDTTNLDGVSADLVVRPFQWKGTVATIREFNRDAAHNEIGMQAVEITGDNVDGDGDGIANEVTVGDITALTVYLAAQPRPTTAIELSDWGLIDAMSAAAKNEIAVGAAVFNRIGCASCHIPQLPLKDPVFSEPSQHPAYRDASFPAGQSPAARGLTWHYPITFDLTKDQPDNQLRDGSGNVVHALGSFKTDAQGRAIIELYGDLKRHNIGGRLAESIDEERTGAGVFLTRNLWGVGSTGPYLHDGRATTLTEAILEHGGEAIDSRRNFLNPMITSYDQQHALIAFLNNLVLFKTEGNEVVIPPPPSLALSPQLTMRTLRK
jgi:hypothetical protein